MFDVVNVDVNNLGQFNCTLSPLECTVLTVLPSTQIEDTIKKQCQVMQSMKTHSVTQSVVEEYLGNWSGPSIVNHFTVLTSICIKMWTLYLECTIWNCKCYNSITDSVWLIIGFELTLSRHTYVRRVILWTLFIDIMNQNNTCLCLSW